MKKRTFNAPGKLMLAGEYSVLGPGGVALALAIEPGIDAVVEPSGRWELGRHGVSPDGPVRWVEGEAAVPGPLAYAHGALQTALRRLGPLAPHRIETRLPTALGHDPARKPGVGGSASATAVVAAAVHAIGGVDPALERDAVLDAALQAHHEVQGGGSGYDVATVVHGGLACWDRERAALEPLPWPAALGFIAGYSGRSARTRRQLAKLERVRTRYVDSVTAELTLLNREVHGLVAALRRGDPKEILERVRGSHRALARWDHRRGLGILTPAVERMIQIAEESGAAAKVSGAGAGDSVIALGAPDSLEAAAAAWRASGFEPLPVDLAAHGVREVRGQ